MKSTALKRAGLCLFAAVFVSAPSAFALLDLDDAAVILSTDLDVSYDSNILGRSGGEGDTTFRFSPSLEYKRAGGRGTIGVTLGGSIVAYASESDRNHEDYRASGSMTLPVSSDSPLSGGVNASYGRSTTVNENVGDLVTTKSLGIGASGGYAFSERLGGTAGLSYGNTENDNYGNNESWGANAGLSFKELIFRRLPLNISYGYSTQQSTDDPSATRKLDTKSHSFNVGTNGQLSSKVDGSLSFGYRSTTDTGTGSGNDSGGLTASTALNWSYDELTKISLTGSKSLAVTVDNESTDTTSLGLLFSRKLSERMSANASASHSWQNYRGLGRNDRYLTLSSGLTYQIRRNWTGGIHYTYTKNNSDSATNDFDRHVIGANITARF